MSRSLARQQGGQGKRGRPQTATGPSCHPRAAKSFFFLVTALLLLPKCAPKQHIPAMGTGLADAGHCGMQHGEHVAPSPTELLGTPTTGTSHPGPFPASAVQSSSTSRVSAWVRKCFLSPFLFPFLSPASTIASEQVGLAELSLHPSQVPQPEPQRWKDSQPTQVRQEINPLPNPE